MTASSADGAHRLVVLGATGWIGREVLAAARRDGWDVVGVGRRSSSSVRATDFDRTNLDRVLAELNPAVVVNCAGVATHDVDELKAMNVDLVRTLCVIADVRGFRLVQLGSAAEYGDPGGADPVGEDHPLRPTSPYGRSKAEATELVLSSCHDGLIARVFNVAGPSPSPESFLAELIDKARAAEHEISLGNAANRRDWISLDFVAEAVTSLAGCDGDPRIVNVCSGWGTTHGELAACLAARLGRTVTIRSHGRVGIDAVIGNPARLAACVGRSERLTPSELAERCLQS